MYYKLFDDTVQITTKGANTLTDGPTIFITQDTVKIAKFCLQLAKIPKETMTKIMINIGNLAPALTAPSNPIKT